MMTLCLVRKPDPRPVGVGIPAPQPGLSNATIALHHDLARARSRLRRPAESRLFKWKQDPRAYGPLPGDTELAAPGGELCTVDDDRVLLECWMGAKWGFYKFPLDPARITAPGPDELSWRPAAATGPPPIAPYRLDLTFDLSLPLPPQLEAAKFRLVSRAAELRRQGLAAPKTVANQRGRWTGCCACSMAPL